MHSCNIINSHTGEWRVLHSSAGIDEFFTETLPDALSVAIFRDPRERLLSRYYYDVMKGKLHRGDADASAGSTQEPAGGNWLSTVEVNRLMAWMKANSHEGGPYGVGHHYRTALPLMLHEEASSEELQEALERFEVIGVTERMPELVAMLALSLNCDGASWAYTSLKRVVGRPTFADLPSHAQKEIIKITSTAYANTAAADRSGADGSNVRRSSASSISDVNDGVQREPVTDFAIWRAAEKIARSREATAGTAFATTLDSLYVSTYVSYY